MTSQLQAFLNGRALEVMKKRGRWCMTSLTGKEQRSPRFKRTPSFVVGIGQGIAGRAGMHQELHAKYAPISSSDEVEWC